MTSALAVKDRFQVLMQDLAAELSTVTPDRYGPAYQFIGAIKSMAEAAIDTFGSRVKNHVLEHGEQVTDKGTRKLVADGWALSAIPTRTGVDPKKLEARLRMKGFNPADYMDMKITYAVSETKLGKALASEVVTQSEIESCRYDLTYRLQVEKEADE